MYVHTAFVALEIFGGVFMGFSFTIRLFISGFQLAGLPGLIACVKYRLGLLRLDEIELKSSASTVGDIYDGSV